MSSLRVLAAGWLSTLALAAGSPVFAGSHEQSPGDTLPTVPLPDRPVLSEDMVLQSSETHFPEILEAIAERQGATADVLAAQGGFDLMFDADGFSRVNGFWDGSVVQGKATQPLGPLGTDIYAGYRLSDGNFPIYEDQYFTNDRGKLSAGVVLSLLRDRDIDDRRFATRDARLALQQADLDVLLTKVGVQQQALIAYWRWVTTGRQLSVLEDLLRIALERQTGLQEQVDSGARARIFLVENRQNIIRRETLVAQAERDFLVAANQLSLFFRDEKGDPVTPVRQQLPPPPPLGELEDLAIHGGADISAALERRPELQILKTSLERARVRASLAQNDLQPQVDLGVEVGTALGDVAEGGVSRDTTETIVGFQFNVPLQRRKAKGALRRQEAEIEKLRQRQRLTADRIEIEVTNILVNLNVAENLLELAEQDVDQTEQLQVAERNRFASGASDFFLVNLREERAANALVAYYLADLNRRVARADYDAATVNLDRLGITEEEYDEDP